LDDQRKSLEIDEQDGHKQWDEFLKEVGEDDKFAAC
jgi:hypothetical protein